MIGRRVLDGVHLRHYLMGRAVRVLPAYYFALVGMVALSIVAGGGRTDPLVPYLVLASGHTLDSSPFFSQAWTLTVEAEFYLVVPFIARLRGSWLLLIGGVSAVLALAPLHLGLLQFAWAFLPGLALARVERSKPGLYGALTSRPVFLAGVVGTAAIMLLNPDPLVGIVGVPATFVLVAGFAGRTVPVRLHGVARWSGDLSYPFYLWHQYPVALLGPGSGSRSLWRAQFASVVGVERPTQRWFAGRREEPGVAPAPAMA